MSDVEQLAWDAIPDAFRIHCCLEAQIPWHKNGQNVIFQTDDADTGCWETTLLPPDDYGPTHVVYFRDRVEVWRYWTSDAGCPDHVATLKWDDPNLLSNVLTAATGDMLEDWATD